MQHCTVAEINLATLRSNYRTMARRAGGAEMIVAVKANAYGHGAAEVARCLAGEGVRTFAVVSLDEALELRAADITQDILVMGVVDPQRVPSAVAGDIAIALHSREHAAECEASARSIGGVLRCHIKVDTGMHRLGMFGDDAMAVAEALAASNAVRVDGLMTHMSHAEEDDLAMTDAQIATFQELIDALRRRELCPAMIHAANSATVLRRPGAALTAVRPGFALYGAAPSPQNSPDIGLRPIMTLKTVVMLIKDIGPGHGVGYCHTWHAERPSRVAALPIGYADGYCRAWSNRASVRIDGQLCPVVGNISMDTTLVDVTDLPAVRVGSSATLIEADLASPLSVHALAHLAGTIPHEVMTGLGSRVRRIYVERDAPGS
jgi:alanine racemase